MRLDEGVVYGHDVDVLVLDGVPEDDTSNAAEAIDSDLVYRGQLAFRLRYGVANSKPTLTTMLG